MPIGSNFPTVLQAARLGAEWAWRELYRELSPPVLRYLRVHGASEPEDLLGDTFVQVVANLASFDGGEQEFRAWVFTIARNNLFGQWRRSRRRPLEYVPPELLHDVVAASDAEDETLRQLAHDRAVATLSRLTPHQRDVIFLRIIAGLSIDEVAHVLRKQPGAVKSLQMRGLAAIRRGFSEEAVS